MASSFPGAIDSFTDPLSGSALNSPSHSSQHADLNSAVNKIENQMGLVKVIPTGATNGTVGATGTVTYSAASTVSVLGCFTSLYQNYDIVITHTGSASTTFSFRMISGASTVDSGSNYFGYGLSFSGTATDQGAASATSQKCGGHSSDSNIPNETNIKMANPNIAKRTQANIHAFDASGPNVLLLGAQVTTTTQYTGIQLIAASGTITGSISVYGYRI